MAPSTTGPLLLLSLLSTLVVSQQQAVLQDTTHGSLPACAQSSACTKLTQASQACGGQTSASLTVWSCFCQSAYSTGLIQSAASICPTVCTSQSDLAQISTWFTANCGSDNGASEHQGTAAAASSPAAGGNTAQPSPTDASAAAASSDSSGSDDTSGNSSKAPPQDWWSGHYQWIIMVIVLLILLPAIGWFGHWLKRRHERRRDQNISGFNTGITTRSGPMVDQDRNESGFVDANESGRNSTARTRDAFMPYGYGYSRSESRVESRNDTRSPAPGTQTPDMEKDAGEMEPSRGKRLSKRVLVRERSGADSIETEKRSRY